MTSMMIRYQPVAPLAGWPARSSIDHLFDRLFAETVSAVPPSRGATGPNLYESPEAYFAEFLLPGVKAEDVAITVQEAVLTVQARRHWEAPAQAQPIWRGFGMGEWQQTLTLPGEVNAGAVQATVQDGILRLELPKAESARAHTIKVNGLIRGAPSAVAIAADGSGEPANGLANGVASEGSAPASGAAVTANA